MQSSAPQAPPPPVSIEDEVLSNLRSQKLGAGTVDDLALPEAFLRRVGDRVIRESFEQRFRAVVTDEALAKMEAEASAQQSAAQAPAPTAPASRPEEPEPSRAPLFTGGGAALIVVLALAARRARARRKARS